MRKNCKVWIALLSFVYSTNSFAQQIQPDIKVQMKHTGLWSMSFSPDGKYAVSGGLEKTINLWDISSGKEIRTFIGHSTMVKSVSFSPDGKFVLSSSYDGSKLWDIYTGKVISTFEGDISSFSPNGKYVLTSFSQFAEDVRNGKYMLTSMVFPILWEISSGKKVKTFESNVLSTSVCFSPDGRYVLSADVDNKIRRWDVKTGELKTFTNPHSQIVNSICVSTNNSYVLSGSSDKTLKLWDISTGMVIRTFNGHKGIVWSAIFSPDGRFVISSGTESYSGSVIIWEVSSGKMIKTFLGNTVGCLSPKGDIVLTAGGMELMKLWDVSSGKVIKTFSGNSDPGGYGPVLFSSEGKYIIQKSFGIGTSFNPWELKLGPLIPSQFYSEKLVGSTANCFSYDSKFALSSEMDINNGSFNSPVNIKLWDVSTKSVIKTFIGHKGIVKSICFSHDGKYALSCGSDNAIILWDIAKGSLVRTFSGHRDIVDAVNFSLDGNYALSGNSYHSVSGSGIKVDYTLKLWKVSNGRNIRAFSGHTNVISTVCFSNDGKYALSGSDDNTIKLWEISSGKEIRTFSGHTNAVKAVCFSPNGKYVVSGSFDNTIKLWDLASGELIYSYITGGNKWLAYDKEGYWDASPDGGTLIAMVKGMEVWNIDQFAVKNNRPDKILARLVETPPDLIKHYYNQYLKRLKKLNMTEDNLSKSFETPETKIIKTIQNGKNVAVSFKINSDSARVKRYNIFVNNVPIFGTKGKEIANTSNIDSKSLMLSEIIELTTGDNMIEISAMNENGAESFRAPTIVSYNPDSPVKPDLYYLGFGVSNYKKAELNLQYADKDAKDMAKVLEKMNVSGQFAKVYSKTLLNEEVTPKSIKLAKDFTKNAKPDDTFILFIAGHGLHDTDPEATYYYLTSNADVNNLKGTAVDFETIEDLLQGIPPRNKLFLMDACESGEIDEEDQGQMIAAATDAGIASRGFKSTNTNVIPSGVEGSKVKRSYLYQKDRYIYNDLVRRSGAIVFSSSKGGELSYERSDIENGLFTEYIIKALTTTEADKDGNGTVSTDELREFVSAQVAKASGDLQHPTVDRDNIYQKFGFQIK